MLVLVDQDGVIADFERGFAEAWRARYPDRICVAPAERRSFYVRDDYPTLLQGDVEAIYHEAGFYAGLLPVPGAIEGLRALLEKGYDVRICTSPLTRYQHCVAEKFQWVDRHLGAEFVGRLVVTKDKTLVRGDVLIDDKPVVAGSLAPSWRRIIFDQPYNRQAVGLRMSWANWDNVLSEAFT